MENTHYAHKLGSVIRYLRKQKNFTQGEFAKICEISQTYLSQIENNVKEPNNKSLRIIAAKLEIPFPVIVYLSLNENDIPVEKRHAYSLLAPTIQTLIKSVFNI